MLHIAMPIPISTGVVSYADVIKLSIIDKNSIREK
jgi:hypothetical protein